MKIPWEEIQKYIIIGCIFGALGFALTTSYENKAELKFFKESLGVSTIQSEKALKDLDARIDKTLKELKTELKTYNDEIRVSLSDLKANDLKHIKQCLARAMSTIGMEYDEYKWLIGLKDEETEKSLVVEAARQNLYRESIPALRSTHVEQVESTRIPTLDVKSSNSEIIELPNENTTPVSRDLQTIDISLDNFKLLYDNQSNKLYVQYRILNNSLNKKRFRGRTIFSLADNTNNPDNWIVIPPCIIRNLNPVGVNGKPFKIVNFIDIRFEILLSEKPTNYTRAYVFVTTEDGKAVKTENFPINNIPEI